MTASTWNLRACVFAAMAFGAITFAHAQDYKLGDLVVGQPWTRETPGGAKLAGGFLSITNNGSAADRLIGGSFEASERLEVHEMKMDGAIMRMRPLDDGIEIKPGETVKFVPGGYHLMFLDLKRPLKKDQMIKGELQFQKAGKMSVKFQVGGVGAAGPTHGSSH